jgi:TonB family protein
LSTAADLSHPHLIRIFETGIYQFDGVHHLYAVMEYADQTLAQLLQSRALTEDEALEMLPPLLGALAFLHGKGLVQGNLKPTNILAVDDELKLATDAVRPASQSGGRADILSVYDPPEALAGSYTAAGDVWALGVSLFEALTRTAPGLPQARTGAIVLPRDLSAPLRGIISSCLSVRPEERPTVTDLEALLPRPSPGIEGAGTWQHPPSAAAPTGEAPLRVSETPTLGSTVSEAGSAAGAVASGESIAPQSARRRAVGLTITAILAILVLSWAGAHWLITPAKSRAADTPPGRQPQMQKPLSVAADRRASSPGTLEVKAEPAAAAQAPAPEVHEEIPNVPKSALQTIHGHVKVAVRVLIDKEGKVTAVLVDQAGPSRYFERLSVEAARKWTFPPDDEQAVRLKLVRFQFTRTGTTAQATALE